MLEHLDLRLPVTVRLDMQPVNEILPMQSLRDPA